MKMLIRFSLERGIILFLILVNCWSIRANVVFTTAPEAGTPQTVVDAFNLAAANWTAVLGDNINVNIDLGWQALGAGVLGRTSYNLVQQDYGTVTAALNGSATSADDLSAYAHLQPGSSYNRLINHTTDNPNGPNSGTPYLNSSSTVSMTRANAKALGLLADGSGIDATIVFNSSMPFDYNPADGTTPGTYDFATIATHELGHALGFISVVNTLEQMPGPAANLPSSILDLFRYSSASLAAGAGVIDSTADMRAKYFSVNGGSTSVAGFATGSVYGTGYAADHWQEFTYVGIMVPESFAGLRRSITTTDLRAFDVIGYKLPEPGTGALVLLGLGILCWRSKRFGR